MFQYYGLLLPAGTLAHKSGRKALLFLFLAVWIEFLRLKPNPPRRFFIQFFMRFQTKFQNFGFNLDIINTNMLFLKSLLTSTKTVCTFRIRKYVFLFCKPSLFFCFLIVFKKKKKSICGHGPNTTQFETLWEKPTVFTFCNISN